jgi:hypothetical protein
MGSWYLMYFLLAAALALLLSWFTATYIFAKTEMGILFLLFLTFQVATVCWANFVSAFFSRTMTGAIGGSIGFLMGYFVTFAWRPDWSHTMNGAVCLLPAGGLAQALGCISLFESNGNGITVDTFHTKEINFRFSTAIAMLVFDCFLYTFLGWYFDKVVPQEFGVREKVWFIFTLYS